MKLDDAPGVEAALAGVRSMLAWRRDPDDASIAATPSRVVRAFVEMTAGYDEKPSEILATVFDDSTYDQMVVLRGVAFSSLCEHHLLPFVGTATVGYVPSRGKVVGLSKLARLVECFARRLQIQERMTTEIALAIEQHLDPVGVGVVVRASHECMACRGVRKAGAEMVTSCLLGVMREDAMARAEFLNLAEWR